MDDITNLSHLHRQRNVGIVIRDVPSNEIRVATEKETAGGKGKGKEKVTSMGKGKENAIQLGVTDKVISKASLAQRARREREKNERQYSPYQVGQRLRRERERTNERMQSRQSANPTSVSPIRMGRLEDAMETTEVIQSAQRQQMLQHPFGHSTSIPSTSLAPDIIRPTSTIQINEPTPTGQLIEEDFCSDGESEDIPMNTEFHAEPQINPCRHFLGKMDVPCNDCKALHWMDERLTKSSKKHPLFGKCCLEGKIKLPNLNTPPPILQALYDGNDDQSKSFRRYTPFKLELKVGCPVMLLRNIAPKDGLCNGTRMMVVRCASHIIEVQILTGDKFGHSAFIPRISLTPSSSELPFRMTRRQFPIRLAYALTINKSQGQSVKFVGVDLRTPVFSHGQLYVALSRCTSFSRISVILPQDETDSSTTNIVYPEVLL